MSGFGFAANMRVFCFARAICATFPRSPSVLYFCLIMAEIKNDDYESNQKE